jgi:dCMP deaminase
MNNDKAYMDCAILMAEHSRCKRAHVGAVIAVDNKIIGMGYNDSPENFPTCEEDGCMIIDGHCQRTEHGELSALKECLRKQKDVKGATVYVTHQPCFYCTKFMLGLGLKEVVFLNRYPDERTPKAFYMMLPTYELSKLTSERKRYLG